jgi:hypothetical protein
MKLKMRWIALAAFAASTGVAVAQNGAGGVDSPKAHEQMTPQSTMHSSVNWAKMRLDEMDATLALFEGKVGALQGDARAKAESALADMRAKREAFRETIKKGKEMGEADWTRAKAALETDWSAFEASVQKYIDAAGVQVDQEKAAFRVRADAQRKAWQDAIDKLDDAAASVTADNKAKVESTMKRMKADAAAAEAKLDKLNRAGTQSWAAFRTALAETRTAFDHANQEAYNAFKGTQGTQ